MKRKISSIIMALVIALGVAAVAVPSSGEAKAASIANGSLTTETGGTSYNGIVLDADKDATFNLGTIDLTNANVGTPLISFLPWSTENSGTYGSFTINFSAGGKTLSIKSFERGNKEFLLAAKGENQTHYGSWNFANGSHEVTNNYGDLAVFKLQRQKDGAVGQSRNMNIADGTEKVQSEVAKAPVNLYYDGATLWGDFGVSQFNNNGKTGFKTDNTVAGADDTAAYYRYPIRKLTADGVGNAAWIPFTADECQNVAVSFTVSEVTAPVKFVVTGLYSDVLVVDQQIVQAQVNAEYPLPAPALLTKNSAITSFVDGGKYTVYKGTDTTATPFVTETAFAADSKFTPDAEGTYTIVYSINVGTTEAPEIITSTVSVQAVATVPDAVINLTNTLLDGDTVTINETVAIGATVTNPAQKPVQAVTCNIVKNGTNVETDYSLAADTEYTFTKEGEYTITYTTTDLLSRTVTETVTFYVSRANAEFVGALSATMLYEDGSEVPAPSVEDVKLFDVVESTIHTPFGGTIKVTKPDGTTVDYDATFSFAAEGKYVVSYEVTYTSQISVPEQYTARAQRIIYVYNQDVPSITVAKLPVNVVAKSGTTVNDEIIKVKAITGTEITFPYGFFASAQSIDNVTLVTASTGASVNLTTNFASGAYVFTPAAAGTYSLSAEVQLGRYRAVRTVEIEVKNAWYELVSAPARTVTVGDKLEGLAPVIKDYYGNTVAASSVTVDVYFNYARKGGEGTVAEKIGLYEVKYSFTDAAKGEAISGSYFVTAIDDEKPVITLTNKKTKASKNSFVELANVTVTDKSGQNVNAIVAVYKDGKAVSVYNNGFDANEEGTYEVVYTATDAAGNQQVTTYSIEIGGASTGLIVGIAVGGGVLVLLIAAAVVLIVLHKKGIVELGFGKKKADAASAEAKKTEENVSEEKPEN